MLIFILTLLFMLALLDKALRLDKQRSFALTVEFAISKVRDDLVLRVARGEQPVNDAYRSFDELTERARLCLEIPLFWEWALIKAVVEGDAVKADPEYAQLNILMKHKDNRPVAEAFQQFQAILGQ